MRQPSYIYKELQGMTDAGGWKAVFVEKHEHGFPYLSEEPLVGWGAIAVYGVYEEEGKETSMQVDTEIRGLVARDEVEEASDSPNFMGYIGPAEDRNVYLDEMLAKLATAESVNTQEDEDGHDHDD